MREARREVPRPRRVRALRVAHFFCGLRCPGDLQDWAERLASSKGVPLSVLSVDILHGSGGDVTDHETLGQWRSWIRRGAVQTCAGERPGELRMSTASAGVQLLTEEMSQVEW